MKNKFTAKLLTSLTSKVIMRPDNIWFMSVVKVNICRSSFTEMETYQQDAEAGAAARRSRGDEEEEAVEVRWRQMRLQLIPL